MIWSFLKKLKESVGHSTKACQMELVLLLISIIPGIVSHSMCPVKMCLRWTIRNGILTVICKIDDLYLPVYIHTNGKEIARCIIPFPSPLCFPLKSNIAVKQNISTNETVVKVRGSMDHRINGNWSCRHGLGRNTHQADIEINIPTFNGRNKTYENDDLRCLKEISFYTVTGIVVSLVTFIIICLILICKCKFTKRKSNDFNAIVSFAKKIDECFENGICQHKSIKNVKIVFFIFFVLLVLTAGGIIGLLGKDSCTGSFAFIIFGVSICLVLLILFFRREGTVSDSAEEENDEGENGLGGIEANRLVNDTATCSEDDGANESVTIV